MKIVGLIPARLGSRRLKEKNIRLINGKPMIYYAIKACKDSYFIDEVYVSTESTKIARIAENYQAKVVMRPPELAEDDIPTQYVFRHFAEQVDFDILVCVQSNSPQVKPENIDKAVKKLLDHGLWEVRSVNSEGVENGAFWVLERKTIFWNGLSVYFGVVEDNAIDIHFTEDLKKVRRLMKDGES